MIVPRSFFSEVDWHAVEALVAEKMPSAAKAHAAARAAQLEKRRSAWRWRVALWALMVGLLYLIWRFLGADGAQ